jgi:dipeptidase D
LTITPYEDIQDDRAMTAGSTRKTLDLLFAIPHGVDAMSTEIKNAIETSNNLAKVSTEEGKLQVQTSQRSSVWSRVLALTNRIEAIARLAGGEAQSTEGYPGWQPNWDSPLIEKCQKVYKRVFRKQPRVEVIHGGLECGMIGGTYPGMDMIAFGPTIKNPHSPSERIEIESIGKIWDFMVALLRNLK